MSKHITTRVPRAAGRAIRTCTLVLVAGAGCAQSEASSREASSAAASGAAGSAAAPSGGEASSREAELRSAIAAFRTTLNSGDSAGFYRLLAPDLEVFAPNARPIRGAEALASFRPLFTQAKADIGPFTDEEITVSGDVAIQRHSYRLSTTPRSGGPVTTVRGSGLHIWKRTPDGQWQIVKDIWTTPPAS